MSRAPDLARSGGGGGECGDEASGDGGGGDGNGDGSGDGGGDGDGLATAGVVEGALEQTTAVASSWLHRSGMLAWSTHLRILPAKSPSDAKWP